jgi:S-formylglutathione hydrolase FrmB
LPGLGGDDASFFRRHVDLDEVLSSIGRDAIIASVDTSTKLGSSYLVNSSLDGDFDSFLAEAVPTAIDKRYRTLARGTGRALIGQSTGGFNAVSFGLRHSDLFGAIAAMSPDALDMAAWLAPDGKTVLLPWLHLLRIEDAMKGPGQMTSYAASFSPDAAAPRGYAWPCDLATGLLIDAVWSKWLSYSPSTLVARPDLLEAARAHLSGRIYITVARDDEFDLYAPAKRFFEQLAAAGVDATFVPTEGGHTEGVEARERASLEFLLRALDPAKP